MVKNKIKKPIPAAVSFFLAGAFLAVESGRLLLTFQWDRQGIGLPMISGLLCMIAGFCIASLKRMRNGGSTGIAGALLLTLHAGAFNHPISWICSFIFAGGIAAFFVRTRKQNTFIPFNAGFVPALFAVTFFPFFSADISIILAMMLTGILIVNSLNIKKFRWIFLLLIPVQSILFTGDEKYEKRILSDIEQMRHTAVSALPASLIPDAEPGKISVLQITRRKQYFDLVPWKNLPFVRNTVQIALYNSVPPGEKLDNLKKMRQKFDIISIEQLPYWHESSIINMMKKLQELQDPHHGIITYPYSLAVISEKKSFAVPGSDNKRFASGNISAKHFDIERLDKVLERHLKTVGSENMIPPGVFSALFFQKKAVNIQHSQIKQYPQIHKSWWFWGILGGLWLLARAVVTRRGNISAFFAAFDNTASVTLVILCSFFMIAGNRMYSDISELFLLWTIVLILPCCGRKGAFEKSLLLCSMILPWLLITSIQGEKCSWTALATALAGAFSAGITSAKLMLEKGAVRKQLIMAALCGILFAAMIFSLLYNPGNITPLIAIATVLRSSCLLRK